MDLSPHVSRAFVLSTAHDLLEREGPSALTVDRVAEVSGVGADMVARYVESDEALLDAVAEDGFGALESWLRRGVDRRGDDRAMRALQAFLDFALEHRPLYTLMFLTARSEIRQFPSDFEAQRSACFRLVCGALREEMAAGTLVPDDPLEATMTLWAHAHGLISMFFVGRFGRDATIFRGLYARSIKRVLRGLAEPALCNRVG